MTRLALLIHMITPYHIPLYQRLGESFDLKVFHGGQESNRSAWESPESGLSNAQVKRSWGFKILFRKRDKNGKLFDIKYLHITPGYLWDLIRYSPDAIITNEMGFRTAVALLYAMIFRRPVWIWSGVTCQTEQSIGTVKRLIRSIISRSPSRWISYGEAATEYLQTLNIPRHRIVQLQNCVDERLFQRKIDPSLNLSPKPVFLFVGQLIQRKGINLLLESVNHLQKKGYSFSLAIVGQGADESVLKDYVKSNQLKDIHFLGGKLPAELPAIYRSADFFVFPTLEDIWGLVVNEALWCDLPVIASIYAGCVREILPEENHFDPLDFASITDVLERALNGQIAPADSSCLYTHKQISQRIIDDIQKILVQTSQTRKPIKQQIR
jgi:glycosyltransferase involved in cell wall biosynthesis